MQGGHWAIADAVMEKKTKARGPGHPQGMMKASGTLLQHTTLKSGCNSWKKKPQMGK